MNIVLANATSATPQKTIIIRHFVPSDAAVVRYSPQRYEWHVYDEFSINASVEYIKLHDTIKSDGRLQRLTTLYRGTKFTMLRDEYDILGHGFVPIESRIPVEGDTPCSSK